jgi:hypothetical protein
MMRYEPKSTENRAMKWAMWVVVAFVAFMVAQTALAVFAQATQKLLSGVR